MEQRESTLQQRSRRDHTQRRRAEETPEQREGRLQRDRQRRERRRAAETREQREARLLRDRDRQGRRRAAETQEHREVRLQGRREREQRGAETQEQREVCLRCSPPFSSLPISLKPPLPLLRCLLGSPPPSHHNYASVPSSSFALLCSHLVLSHLVPDTRFTFRLRFSIRSPTTLQRTCTNYLLAPAQARPT